MDQKEFLKKIKTELSKHITVKSICLFGSRARGDFHIDSDYDIAIISPDFNGLRPLTRYKLVEPLIRKKTGAVPLDIACYTPEEYERGKQGFLPKIIEEEGIRV